MIHSRAVFRELDKKGVDVLNGFINTNVQKNWDPEGKQARNKKQENMRRSDVGGSRGHVTRIVSR